MHLSKDEQDVIERMEDAVGNLRLVVKDAAELDMSLTITYGYLQVPNSFVMTDKTPIRLTIKTGEIEL